MWELDYKESWAPKKLLLLDCGVGEDSWEPLGLQRDPTSQSWKKSVLNIHWKDWCWSWRSSTLATWWEELTLCKRPWRWERLKVGGEGDDRGWDGWMASPTQWTWVWASSGSWWWTGNPSMLQSMGSQSQTQLSVWIEMTEHESRWADQYCPKGPHAWWKSSASDCPSQQPLATRGCQAS